MQRTKIPWADYVWNPLSGCSPASEGCEHCYAKTFARRFHQPWGKPVYHPERTGTVLYSRTKSGRIFVCSTSDLFHEQAPIQAQRTVFDVALQRPDLTFIILTKRPNNMVRFMATELVTQPDRRKNIWLGVTAENQARYDERWPILASIPAAVRFVSIEPMLGPVDLGNCIGLDWIIAGPETGAGKRFCDPSWIPDIYARCAVCNIRFFDKRDVPNAVREWPG